MLGLGNVGKCIQVAIATQELIVSGWVFVTYTRNGEECVKEAHNIIDGTFVEFNTDDEFVSWLLNKAADLRELNKNQDTNKGGE